MTGFSSSGRYDSEPVPVENSRPVGVFDSGVGGLSVLAALVKIMPLENYVYIGDSKNAPYGNKSHDEVAQISLSNARTLLSLGCKAIVVACNTATAAAVETLRAAFPEVPVIGIEPALKPAFVHGCRNVTVLATPRTVAEGRFKSLLSRLSAEYGGRARGVGCPGLSGMVENRTVTDEYFEDIFSRPENAGTDGVVLGCTHYSFAVENIRRASGGLPVFDGAEGTARQTKRLLEERGRLNKTGRGSIVFYDDDGRSGAFWQDVARPFAR